MEKLNIAELLKDCPKGMELDCTVYDSVQLDAITEGHIYPIDIQTPEGIISLSEYGCYSLNSQAKCVIFPKGKTTWKGFVPPSESKDGDIAISDRGGIHLLRTKDSSYCAYRDYWIGSNKFDNTITTGVEIVRLATEEEKQKLFDAIKANGYKWNPDTKTLEKLIEPKFKVGDRIRHRSGTGEIKTISKIVDEYCFEGRGFILFSEQDNWELVPNKFDITTLKPFESKVLVRSSNDDMWKPAIWGIYNDIYCSAYPYITTYGAVCQCIPYESNKYLLGTTDDCDDFYKTWE